MNSQIIQIIETGGLIILGFGYVYAQFFKGKNARAKEDLETENSLTTYLKNQINGFKEIVEEQNKKIIELGKEVASLRAVIEEKDNTIQKYLDILQNRNPELEVFMQESKVFHQGQTQVLEKIGRFMETINKHLEKQSEDIEVLTTVTHPKIK